MIYNAYVLPGRRDRDVITRVTDAFIEERRCESDEDRRQRVTKKEEGATDAVGES